LTQKAWTKERQEGFDAWTRLAIWGNAIGFGCDMLDLNKFEERSNGQCRNVPWPLNS
jgi:hypothetical protein